MQCQLTAIVKYISVKMLFPEAIKLKFFLLYQARKNHKFCYLSVRQRERAPKGGNARLAA